jgi:hypothetical protein
MACNGRNHRSNCTCGFRGGRHGASRQAKPAGLAGSRARLSVGNWSSSRLQRRHFGVPNAKCFKCGQPVYFYRDRRGGSAYFNKMEHPWPKHPCTDAAARRRGRRYFAGFDPNTQDMFAEAGSFDDLQWIPLVGVRRLLLDWGHSVFAYVATNVDSRQPLYFVTNCELYLEAPLLCVPPTGVGGAFKVTSPEVNGGHPLTCRAAADGGKRSLRQAAAIIGAVCAHGWVSSGMVRS